MPHELTSIACLGPCTASWVFSNEGRLVRQCFLCDCAIPLDRAAQARVGAQGAIESANEETPNERAVQRRTDCVPKLRPLHQVTLFKEVACA
jgi:hypothetical protein